MSAARGPIPTADEVLQNAGAFGAHLGFGSIAGYAAGKAMRAGTNIGLALAGAGFIGAQMLQSRGYISVDWKKVETEVRAALDVDGDGALTAKDASIAWDTVVDSMRVGVPGGTGFAAGAAAGFAGGGVAKIVLAGGLMPAAAALSAADAYAKSAHFREHLAVSYPRVAEELASRLGAGAVDAAGERGDAAFRAALSAVKGDTSPARALDELRVRVRRNDAGLERNAVRARLALVDELRREKKAGR
jgi:uncharacterized membrane protein (Fun14 family)